MKRIAKFTLLISVSACFSNHFIACAENDKDGIFCEITGYKWSINPYRSPDGTICDIEFGEDGDHYAYLAFNSDSTVDISSKVMANSTLAIPDSATAVRIGIIVIGVIPLCIAVAGIIVWRRRRRL